MPGAGGYSDSPGKTWEVSGGPSGGSGRGNGTEGQILAVLGGVM